MKNHIAKILTLFIFLNTACKKINDNPQWDIEVLGPVLFATLTLDELLADTLRQNNADGTVSILAEHSFYDFNIDSIYNIPDTTIDNVVVWPIFSTSITAGTPFYSTDNKIALGVGAVKLTKALMQKGNIQIQLKNTLPVKVIYTYSIPKAKKAGVVFSFVQEVQAADANGPGIYSGSYDLAGYELDLTGVNGNLFNTISYNVEAQSDPSGNAFTINLNDTVINLKSELSDLEPVYVKGYLGQNSIAENSFSTTGLARFIEDGFIQLDSVTMDITLKNFIGADAQFFFRSLGAYNSRTNTSVSLSAPSFLNRSLNVNRARESGPVPSPVISSNHLYHLDNSNSNLRSFVENLPERIVYNADLTLNPLGNISFYNDFLYSDKLVDAKLSLKMPFRFAANNLTLVDTQNVSLDALTDLDPIGPLTLTLIAKNGFPVNFNIHLYILDENKILKDSILIPGFIRSANVNQQYDVISSTTTKFEIPIDENRKENFRTGKYIAIRTIFNTPDYAQLIQLRSDHKLDLKLIANGTYYIR
ncbi:MAG TPA: hypothetical protein PKJ62_05830 [Bacteroidia bacterium]|nr:hypothetical protein [Bacteroidia bacterium]HNS12601.1 hypothetical protein [Bacteroidia bacterium]